MARLGFDFEAGRLDESAHPFCGGTPADIRITTRYREDEIVSALMGVLHETGHALYEAGPAQGLGRPAGRRGAGHRRPREPVAADRDAGLPLAGLHRLSRRRAAPHLRRRPRPARPDNLLRIYSRVERGFIRVEADEATYPLHVILRHRLERQLIAGDLAVADLPGAWNDGMRELLGIVPPDDRRGCLQDIHWPVGGFGYFPCYTLGAMLAAQLFNAGPGASAGPAGRDRQRRLRAAAGLAARQGARPGCQAPLRRADRAGIGRPACGRAVPGASARAVSCLAGRQIRGQDSPIPASHCAAEQLSGQWHRVVAHPLGCGQARPRPSRRNLRPELADRSARWCNRMGAGEMMVLDRPQRARPPRRLPLPARRGGESAA